MRRFLNLKTFVMFMMAASLLTFTGCKDYDDDINALQEQINAIKASMKTDLDALSTKVDKAVKDAVKDLEAKVAKAQAAADAAKALAAKGASPEAVKAAEEKAKEAAEAVKKAQEAADAAKKEAADLKEQIADLKADVDALKANGSNGGNNGNADVEALKTQIEELKAKVAKMGGATLASLVFLPDYVYDEGGALPVVSFDVVKTEKECAGDIVAKMVEVKYLISPSNVTADKIEKITFTTNDPKITISTRATSEVKISEAKEGDFSIQDGILTVKLKVENPEKIQRWVIKDENGVYRYNTKITQFVARVWLKDGENETITSDWAKLASDVKFIGLTKAEKRKTDVHAWEFYGLKETVKGAEDIEIATEPAATDVVVNNSNYTLVDFVYNTELDLAKQVKAMYTAKRDIYDSDYAADRHWTKDITAEELKKLGFTWEFDLKDEKGKTIEYFLGGNKTDQQKFIKLDGTKVTTRVYDAAGQPKMDNRASIGRTPIVHVMLKKGDCVVEEGFLKLNIIDKKAGTTDPVDVEFKATDVVVKCTDPIKIYTVGTQEMNVKFYDKVNMTKKEFHDAYTTLELGTTGVGTVTQVPDPNDTESYNLVYTLTKEEAYDALGTADEATVTKKATYKATGKADITIKFTVKVKREELEINAAELAYFGDGYKFIKHSTRTPNNGDASDKLTFTNDVLTSFKQDPNEKGKLLGLPKKYTSEFVFVSKYGYTATNGGKTLMYGSVKIAEFDGTTIKYQETKEALEILNKNEYVKSRVEIVVKNSCGEVVGIKESNINGKEFDIRFERPLEVEGKGVAKLYDAENFGNPGSYVEVKDFLRIYDWRNGEKNTKNFDFDKKGNEFLYGYYGVKALTLDRTSIEATYEDGTPFKYNEIVKRDGKDVERLDFQLVSNTPLDPNDLGRFTYKNNGTVLKKALIVKIKINVEYKYGVITSDYITIKIEPTDVAYPGN